MMMMMMMMMAFSTKLQENTLTILDGRRPL